MKLFDKLLGKHKLNSFYIIEYDTGENLRICCALNKGKRDYYDFENKRIVYAFDVTFSRRLNNYTTICDDKYISEEEALQLTKENMPWFKYHLKNSEVSKKSHQIYD